MEDLPDFYQFSFHFKEPDRYFHCVAYQERHKEGRDIPGSSQPSARTRWDLHPSSPSPVSWAARGCRMAGPEETDPGSRQGAWGPEVPGVPGRRRMGQGAACLLGGWSASVTRAEQHRWDTRRLHPIHGHPRGAQSPAAQSMERQAWGHRPKTDPTERTCSPWRYRGW